MDHPRVKLAIYSSIRRHNIMPLMFKILDSSYLKSVKSRVFDVYDQEYNAPDGGNGKPEWATKRCLEKIFESPRVEEMGFGFKNTLMIDSEAEKVRDYPLNSLVLEPYTLEDVLQSEEESK